MRIRPKIQVTPFMVPAELRAKDIELTVTSWLCTPIESADAPDKLPRIKKQKVNVETVREEVIATNPTFEQIQELVFSLDWELLYNFITVRISEYNWLQAHGGPDPEPSGQYAISSCVDAVDFASIDLVASLDTAVELLNSYAQRDDRWRTMIKWF